MVTGKACSVVPTSGPDRARQRIPLRNLVPLRRLNARRARRCATSSRKASCVASRSVTSVSDNQHATPCATPFLLKLQLQTEACVPHARTHTHTHPCTHTHARPHALTHTHARTQIHALTHAHACTPTNSLTHTHVHLCTHTHKHTPHTLVYLSYCCSIPSVDLIVFLWKLFVFLWKVCVVPCSVSSTGACARLAYVRPRTHFKSRCVSPIPPHC